MKSHTPEELLQILETNWDTWVETADYLIISYVLKWEYDNSIGNLFVGKQNFDKVYKALQDTILAYAKDSGPIDQLNFDSRIEQGDDYGTITITRRYTNPIICIIKFEHGWYDIEQTDNSASSTYGFEYRYTQPGMGSAACMGWYYDNEIDNSLKQGLINQVDAMILKGMKITPQMQNYRNDLEDLFG